MINRSLELYPNGDVLESIGHISMFLTRTDSISMQFNVEYKMIVVGVSKSGVQGSKSSKEFQKHGWGWRKLLSHEELVECEKEYKQLRLVCEVRTFLVEYEIIINFHSSDRTFIDIRSQRIEHSS